MGGLTGILLIVIVFLLVSGISKLPEVGSGLGRSIRNFKRSLNEPDEIDVTPQDARTQKRTPDK
jgi:sec-independent protein translocase protein TatA